jgi:AraC-like DNA-binding protein
MSNDTLSDVLRTVRLRSALFFDLSCAGLWRADAPGSGDIATHVMPEVDKVIFFHVVTRGECWVGVQGEQPLKLKCGDLIILPEGDPHVVSSVPGTLMPPGVDWVREMKIYNRPFRLDHPGLAAVPGPSSCGGEPGKDYQVETSLVCGFIGCDKRPFNPLLATLPRLLHLPASAGSHCGPLFAQLAASESGNRRPGSEALLERMSEMMFVDAIRRHIELMPAESTGWLAGLRDRYVGRALALMHEEPAAAWTIDGLGEQVGLSRSALHERFVAMIGMPPIQYLTQWRMQLASRLLRESQSTVLSVALRVGYDSEGAFGRAFKRLVGMPPAAWRRKHGQRIAA